MKTAWSIFRDFVNSKEIGHVFKNQDLVVFSRIKQINESSLLGYLSLIKQAKFVQRIGRGQYQLVDHMPESLTMGALFALLKGDNLTYVESVQETKDLKILKAQFKKDRDEVLKQLINEVSKYIPLAETIESPAFGLKQLVRSWTWEVGKEPNPTKIWKIKRITTQND